MNNVGKVFLSYLTEKTVDGFESLDRRFLLSKKFELRFQYRTAEISMPLDKVIAALTLSTNQLFQYLNATKTTKNLSPFSKKEKILLKSFIRLSGIKKKQIPCVKIKNL